MVFFSIKNHFLKWLMCLILGLGFMGAACEGALAVEVMAYVDTTKISANDSVNLTVTVKDGEGSVDVSAIKDFNVLSRGTSSNISIINGQMTKETRANFTLLPLKKGTLIIPKLNVEVDGKIYQTNEIEIQVSQSKPDALKQTSDMFITASVSNAHPFVGEQFTYTLKVYHATRFINARFQPPQFDGFDAKKIENDRQYNTVVSARQYNVIELNYVLIPLTDGHSAISPAMLTCDIAQKEPGRSNRMDPFFDDPFFSTKRYVSKTFSSEVLDIKVQPLPPYSGDVAFSGLVGRFDMKTALDKTQAAVGDSLTLSITLSGKGNIMDAEEPGITIPETFKVYKDAPEEKIDFDRSGYSGTKTFRLALVPIKEGNVFLPPVSYVYFDSSQKKYQVMTSQPIRLDISPSAENNVIAAPENQEATKLPKFEKKQVDFVGRDILPLKEDLDAVDTLSFLTVYGFLAYLLIPFLTYGILRQYLAVSRKQMDDKTLMAQKAMSSLKNAATSKLPEEAFLSALYTALISAVFSASGAKGEALTYAEVKDRLKDKGGEPELANGAAGLLEKIESAKYGGKKLSPATRTDLLEETKNLVRRILK